MHLRKIVNRKEVKALGTIGLLVLVLSAGISGVRAEAGDLQFEKVFETQFKFFCNKWGMDIKKLDRPNSEQVCRCLYEFASPRTSVQVKKGVVDLSEQAPVTDFDNVYGQSAMRPQVVEDITLASTRCFNQYGLKNEAPSER